MIIPDSKDFRWIILKPHKQHFEPGTCIDSWVQRNEKYKKTIRNVTCFTQYSRYENMYISAGERRDDSEKNTLQIWTPNPWNINIFEDRSFNKGERYRTIIFKIPTQLLIAQKESKSIFTRITSASTMQEAAEKKLNNDNFLRPLFHEKLDSINIESKHEARRNLLQYENEALKSTVAWFALCFQTNVNKRINTPREAMT